MHGPEASHGATARPSGAPKNPTMEDLLKPTQAEPYMPVRYGKVIVPIGLREDFEAAQRYLATSPEAVKSLSALVNGEHNITIKRSQEGDYYDHERNEIYWNPNSAIVTTDGTTQSPANGLLHEQGHANQYSSDPKRYLIEMKTTDPHHGNVEERRNIAWEATYSHQLGEGVRTDHRAVPFPVAGPADRIPVGVPVMTDPEDVRYAIDSRRRSLANHGYASPPAPGKGEGSVQKWDGKAHSGPVLHLNAATVAQYDEKQGTYQIYDVQKDLGGKIPPMNHQHLTIDHEGKFPAIPTRELAGRNL